MIALRYAKKSFIFDFIAWMPIDLLILITQKSSNLDI